MNRTLARTVEQQGWRHKSVRALIRAEGGGDPQVIIRSKSKRLVEWAKGMGWSGPPYDPLKLASLRGIRSRESINLFSAEAQLTPMDGKQLLLEFNPSRGSGRKNYSISHELVHTLFEDCFEMVHCRKSNPVTFDPEHELELLCQIGAAEILMPEEDFASDLAEIDYSLSSALELSQRYDASREAAARRMLSLGGRKAALVFLSRRLKPSEMKDEISSGESAPVPKMRILYVVPANGFPVFLPEHKSVPDDSCVNEVSNRDEISVGEESWDMPGFGLWAVEAMRLPTPPDSDASVPTVVALIIPPY